MLHALTHAKANIKPAFNKVGDIRPNNIFINDRSEIKVSNLNSWPRELTNYAKTFENEVTYLAPEELKQLEIGKIEG